MRPEDYDAVDEGTVEVHEGHSVDTIFSVRLTPDESRLLSDLAKREGIDEIGTLRAALHEYAARRSQSAQS